VEGRALAFVPRFRFKEGPVASTGAPLHISPGSVCADVGRIGWVLTSTRKMAMRKGSSTRSGAIASTTLSSLARCNAPGPLSRTISIVSENFTRLSRPAIKAAIGKRSDFGMKTFLGAIGDDVDLIIVKSRPSRSPEEFAGTRRLTREELRPIKGVS
jgi:hypothetical protein